MKILSSLTLTLTELRENLGKLRLDLTISLPKINPRKQTKNEEIGIYCGGVTCFTL